MPKHATKKELRPRKSRARSARSAAAPSGYMPHPLQLEFAFIMIRHRTCAVGAVRDALIKSPPIVTTAPTVKSPPLDQPEPDWGRIWDFTGDQLEED